MVSKIISVLAFASIVLAHPHPHADKHRPWRYYGSGNKPGRADGVAAPTGFSAPPTNDSNPINIAGAPIDPPSGANDDLQTVTVVPVPDESAEPASSGIEQLLSQSSAVDLDATGSLTAAAFFGRPTGNGRRSTYAWGGDQGVPSASDPAAAPTTFQTAVYTEPTAAYGGDSPVATSASSPAESYTPSTGSSGGSTSGKKGLSYNNPSLTNAFAGKGISWAYNWGSRPDGAILSGAEFVPMLWGNKQDFISSWAGAASTAISNGARHALSFNEPDLGEQANMDASTAARLHIENMNPLAGQVAIGSPAVTNGPPPMGIAYLNQWFNACAGNCKVDFVAFHWYDAAGNIEYFKKHVQDVIDAAAKNGVGKVWLTEFGASGSDSQVANFISEAVAFLDSTPAVERYAYFMVSDGILVSGNSLSTLGSAYAA
ncbi:hypothetical protein B0A52_09152 [Exophiala mesophila]|uniref:Asl1-like glycosyl hydrolase catalytic domain-containing protein n=1 Tax=Exophiala mesophila TaxID=212818 RepID=A0A438MUF9_EXOME|nr:hypothetical protein B0A52_09152 [Exophiala mesophila]